jgi:undecaprenyl-diphosphatase
VRTPSSASFPSGHTLAAFSTALVLPESAAGSAAALGFAASVAASRVHLGAHHASDVVAGAAVGTVLGLVLRRGLGRLLPDRRPAAR